MGKRVYCESPYRDSVALEDQGYQNYFKYFEKNGDGNFEPKPSEKRTSYAPGSKGKMLVLAARIEMGQDLWHDDDEPVLIVEKDEKEDQRLLVDGPDWNEFFESDYHELTMGVHFLSRGEITNQIRNEARNRNMTIRTSSQGQKLLVWVGRKESKNLIAKSA